ncbi:creatininase family protein [Kineosporia succinea]|uniref:Creatinine amidohydrolase/Fe(II)-dependent formamide hydrolase-like protein n=1 Tax=Kineosporia succinea TaxID=84632 RepID=A0ABT9PAU4_9ACTN|nr:creatininase family protein [Kineosporia succinea]MDP9829810.1 creatinine amidohydrolase/Fe(II)-dependent formamide hydrolase-like protein [Kineosporia succinea]
MTQHPQYLTRLTTNGIDALDKSRAVVVQPIGAIEQHGPHLPVMTDAFVAEQVAARAATPDVWLLPPLSYGKSNEHVGWAGTISLDATTLYAVCRDLGRSLAASGFSRLAFVNGHGGNPSLLDVAARDIRVETGLMVFPVTTGRLGTPAGLDLPDAEFSIHGGHVETSIMLHLAPDTVHMDLAEPGGAHLPDLFPGELSLEDALPTAWVTDDLTTNGVIGDPTSATAETGAAIVGHWTTRLSAAYEQMATFAFRTA